MCIQCSILMGNYIRLAVDTSNMVSNIDVSRNLQSWQLCCKESSIFSWGKTWEVAHLVVESLSILQFWTSKSSNLENFIVTSLITLLPEDRVKLVHIQHIQLSEMGQ